MGQPDETDECVAEEPAATMTDDAWDGLLERIADGGVIPVVGSQLLVDPAGRSIPARVAARLLATLSPGADASALSPGRELDDAIEFLQRSGAIGPSRLYEAVYHAIKAVTGSEADIPRALSQLAEIDGFRFLVTVTPDDMLQRCLAKRARVHEFIARSAYAQNRTSETLVRGPHAAPDVVDLLYLFGKAKPTPGFAINEEDVLEYAHDFLTGRALPSELRDELSSRNMLFIGCHFPDWLSRLLLRATNHGRLSSVRDKREWMVERLQPRESLTLFLNNFSKDTVILSEMEPAAFVGELHRRWKRRIDTGAASGTALSGGSSPRGALFFVSYSRLTDLKRAEALCESLLKMGVRSDEIWFDRHSLEPAEDFQQKILAGIRDCRYFVPLLSADAVARGEAFVLKEWRAANRRLEGMGRTFIAPMIIDPEFEPDRFINPGREVPDWPVLQWENLNFCHAPEGNPDGRTLHALKNLVRLASDVRSVS